MTYDVIVLGVGGVGSAALFHAAARGAKVLGIDRFAPGHNRGSSHGDTRLIRQAYYEHPDYVPLVQRAYALWSELEQRTGRKLYEETGILEVGREDGPIITGVRESARQHRLPIEELSANEVSQRFSGFRIPETETAIFEPRAGFLKVEDCVTSYAFEAEKLGAELRIGETAQAWKALGGGVEVTTDQGVYQAKSLVISSGSWAPGFLSTLGIPLEVVRKSLYWFETNEKRYNLGRGGVGFIFETPRGNFYGFPELANQGLKVAEHTGGHPTTDPLNVDRTEDPIETARVADFTSRYLPYVSSRQTRFATCLYTLSPDRNFVVDRHPEFPQVSFAAGLSGHGFKFTSVLGEILSDWATESTTRQPVAFLNCRRSALQG